MVFPVVGGNESKGYDVENSLRFNDGDSAYLSRTPSTPTSNDIGTFSFWFKKTNISDLVNIVGAYDGSANNSFDIQFHSDDRLRIRFGNTALHETSTSQLFRDPSAWYHVLFAIDTTQATDSNRIKFYVNGTQITDFNATSYPNQNVDCLLLTGNSHKIGTTYNAGGNMLGGYLSEVYLIDGQALSPTDFGEFDDNGVWIPKKYTGTFGNNGYFLEFKQTGTSANSSGIGADTSGNDNHFTPTNLAATDITEDTCTNNFATLNALDHRLGSCTLSEGNCKFVGANGGSGKTVSTIGVTSGKWYAEFKVLNTHKARIGIIDQTGHDVNDAGTNDGVDYSVSDGYIYTYLNGTNNDTGNNSSSSGVDLDNPSANDIIGIALDADNEKVRFYRNGTAEGTEGDGFTPLQRTGTGETYFFHVRDGSGSGDDEPQIECNFGNAPFSISSGNTDGKYGNFEYAPPSGFYALCTKRLAEFG